MQCLSRHFEANIYDVRRVVNIHEMSQDFHKYSGLQKPKTKQTQTSFVTYRIDRQKGQIKRIDGTFNPNSRQFQAVIGMHMKVFYEDALDINAVEVMIEARRIQGLEHPNNCDMPWESHEGRATSIMCVRHENVDGGFLELQRRRMTHDASIVALRKELSPAYFAELNEHTDFRFTPTMSFDGKQEGYQDLFIINSAECA